MSVIGIIGSNPNGHIALDDFSFTQVNCAVYPPEVQNELNSIYIGATTMSPSQTNGTDMACNFDKNTTCGWTDDRYADFKWTVQKGSTDSLDTGPTAGINLKKIIEVNNLNKKICF